MKSSAPKFLERQTTHSSAILARVLNQTVNAQKGVGGVRRNYITIILAVCISKDYGCIISNQPIEGRKTNCSLRCEGAVKTSSSSMWRYSYGMSGRSVDSCYYSWRLLVSANDKCCQGWDIIGVLLCRINFEHLLSKTIFTEKSERATAWSYQIFGNFDMMWIMVWTLEVLTSNSSSSWHCFYLL